MTIEPRYIDRADLLQLRRDIASDHGIGLYRQYSEREAAALLLSPEKRRTGTVDVSTLKRKRRSGKIPHVPLGDGSIGYLGMMLCDFIAFGERSVQLWGSDHVRIVPPNPASSSAPPL